MEVGQLDPGGDYLDADIKGIGSERIKLFVGQIPRTWEESEVRLVLEPFGAIQELTILRDRNTKDHKGCAFVTYISRQSAVEAQKTLHEKKTLLGMNHPMQVKPATNEPKLSPFEERRLFVGMLCRDYTEEDLHLMFSTYGHVEDVSILRNAEGKSKGAAFVRLSSKAEANNAITGLHHSQTLLGCSAPLVVKIADTEREKNAKRLHGALNAVGGVNGVNGLGFNSLGVSPLHAAAYYQLLQLQAGGGGTSVNNSFGLGTPLSNNLALAALNQQHSPTSSTLPGSSFSVPTIGGSGTSSMGNLSSAMLSAANSSGHHLGGKSTLGMGIGSDSPVSYLGVQPQSQSSFSPFHQLSSGQNYVIKQQQQQQQLQHQQLLQHQQYQQKSLVYSKQREGPDGCNLFIYHLPNEVLDTDLNQMFSPFGTVLSSKVFIDKVTNLSKCFGFVSYDNTTSAQSAIQAMNGFQIGTKRLKVQLKKPKENTRPY